MAFSDNIRSIREAFSLNQKDLADVLGVTLSAVSMWERGERVPKFETIYKIGEKYHLSTTDLMEDSLSTREIINLQNNKEYHDKLFKETRLLDNNSLRILIETAKAMKLKD